MGNRIKVDPVPYLQSEELGLLHPEKHLTPNLIIDKMQSQ